MSHINNLHLMEAALLNRLEVWQCVNLWFFLFLFYGENLFQLCFKWHLKWALSPTTFHSVYKILSSLCIKTNDLSCNILIRSSWTSWKDWHQRWCNCPHWWGISTVRIVTQIPRTSKSMSLIFTIEYAKPFICLFYYYLLI